MKHLTKKLSTLIALGVMMCFCLTGCTPSFDASAYIQSCLDANTKGEFEAYAEITNSSIEEVEALYNSAIDTEMAYIDAYNVSDEKKEEFRQLFIKMYKNFKYEVGEATRNEDDSYTVPVTTYKLMIFEGIMDEGEDYLMSYAQAEVDAGRTPTQEQLETEALNYMYDKMSANLDKLEYSEPQTFNIVVSPSKNGSTTIYSADTSELQELVETLVDVENAQ